MNIVFHPLAWLQTMPKDARFFPSKEVLRKHHPDLTDDEIVETPYVGLMDDRHVVSKDEPVLAPAEVVEFNNAIDEASGLDDAPEKPKDEAPADVSAPTPETLAHAGIEPATLEDPAPAPAPKQEKPKHKKGGK